MRTSGPALAGTAAAAVASALAVAGCSAGGTDDRAAALPPATAPAPDTAGTSPARALRDPRIVESSGLALSSRHAGVLWTHNDRGHLPELHAVAPDGATAAVLTLSEGADDSAGDWEDIAVSSRGRIFVGDIGDNERARTTIRVLVVEEPAELVDSVTEPVVHTLRYPDGPHDAEALLVHPFSERIFIATKSPEGGALYSAPEHLSSQVGSVALLERLREVPPNITAGDFAPDGSFLVVRNQPRAFLYGDLDDRRPLVIELPEAPQGESVTVLQRGGDRPPVLLVGSEGPGSAVQRVRASDD